MSRPSEQQGAAREDLTLGVVYVSWRDTHTIARSLERLADSTGIEVRSLPIVIVVNESTAADEDRLRAAWPGATVIANTENRGFGPGCNQGARAIETDVVLFANPDTLAEPAALSEVVSAFQANPHSVGVAPRLVDVGGEGDDEQLLFQLRRFPSLRTDARELLLLDHLFPRNRWQREAHYLDSERDAPFEVEQAAAAALAVRREVFEAIGGFDERFRPAYWEDVDLCVRLADHGPITFWPRARMEHVGGVAADELGRGAFLRMYYRNALRYRTKHYSRPARLSYRAILWTGMVIRALVAARGSQRSRRAAAEYLSVARLALVGAT